VVVLGALNPGLEHVSHRHVEALSFPLNRWSFMSGHHRWKF
jgi:hypothetical protein